VIQHFVGAVVAAPANVWTAVVIARVSIIVVWLQIKISRRIYVKQNVDIQCTHYTEPYVCILVTNIAIIDNMR
jgi:hypothetical protein